LQQNLIKDLDVKITLTSALSDQQNNFDLNKTIQAYTMMLNISPELAMQSFEIEAFAEYIVNKTGADHSLLRDDLDKDEMKQMISQMIAQQQLQSGGLPQ